MLNRKKLFNLNTIAVAVSSSLCCSTVFAEASEQKQETEVIVVTSSLLGDSEVADLKTYTGNRSIITQEQLERTAVRSIDTALQQGTR